VKIFRESKPVVRAGWRLSSEGGDETEEGIRWPIPGGTLASDHRARPLCNGAFENLAGRCIRERDLRPAQNATYLLVGCQTPIGLDDGLLKVCVIAVEDDDTYGLLPGG
jgi:hypothetical protein